MRKILVAILLLVACAPLFSASDVIMVSSAAAVQKVIYSDSSHVNRTTDGVLFGTTYLHYFEEGSALGAVVSVGVYPYHGFYTYTDLRIGTAMRWPMFLYSKDTEGSSFGLYFTFETGVSIDFRSDSDVGYYPFESMGFAAVLDFRKMKVEAAVETAVSFQMEESQVLQITPRIGVSVPLGGNNR